MSSFDDDIRIGDTVAVVGFHGKTMGEVTGWHKDFYGRRIVEVLVDAGVRNVPLPEVTRIRRTISWPSPAGPGKVRTVERRVLW